MRIDAGTHGCRIVEAIYGLPKKLPEKTKRLPPPVYFLDSLPQPFPTPSIPWTFNPHLNKIPRQLVGDFRHPPAEPKNRRLRDVTSAPRNQS